mgnify:CR=1 FL=1
MKIDYDKKANALYVKFKTMPVKSSVVLKNNIILDLDSNKKIIGIEILEANKHLSSPQNIAK